MRVRDRVTLAVGHLEVEPVTLWVGVVELVRVAHWLGEGEEQAEGVGGLPLKVATGDRRLGVGELIGVLEVHWDPESVARLAVRDREGVAVVLGVMLRVGDRLRLEEMHWVPLTVVLRVRVPVLRKEKLRVRDIVGLGLVEVDWLRVMLLVKDRVPVLRKELLRVRDTEGVRVVEVHWLQVMLLVKDLVDVLTKEKLRVGVTVAEEDWPAQGAVSSNKRKGSKPHGTPPPPLRLPGKPPSAQGTSVQSRIYAISIIIASLLKFFP